MVTQPIVVDGFLSLNKPVGFFFLLYLAVRSYLPVTLGRRCCWGWAELLPWGACVHSKLCCWSSLEPISQAFLAFPSPLAEEAGGGCCGDREEEPARPVPEPGPVWSDGDLRSSSSSPAPALELIAGSQLRQQGPESCWSSACNPQAVLPTLLALFIQQPGLLTAS